MSGDHDRETLSRAARALEFAAPAHLVARGGCGRVGATRALRVGDRRAEVAIAHAELDGDVRADSTSRKMREAPATIETSRRPPAAPCALARCGTGKPPDRVDAVARVRSRSAPRGRAGARLRRSAVTARPPMPVLDDVLDVRDGEPVSAPRARGRSRRARSTDRARGRSPRSTTPGTRGSRARSDREIVERVQVVADDLDRELSLHAGQRLFDVVRDRLREAERRRPVRRRARRSSLHRARLAITVELRAATPSGRSGSSRNSAL